MKLHSFFVYDFRNLSSMDVETANPILHLIFGAGLFVAVLCLIDMNGHRWETDKRSCFRCSEPHVHAVNDDVHLQFYPALLA